MDKGKIFFDNQKIFIGCTDGSIEVLELQLEGKKAMNARDFINGNKNFADKQLS